MAEMSATPMRYRVQGEGAEEFDLIALRDRIRSGVLTKEDEVMIVGTDLWKPAGTYPALNRYFSLLKASPVSAAAPSAAGPVETMGSRAAVGLAYPVSSPTSIGIVAIALVTAAIVPLLYLVVTLVNGIYALSVIRKSSQGATKAPSIAEVGSVGAWIGSFLRLIAITLISMWPFFLAFFIPAPFFAKFILAALIVIIYYPACLATVAITGSVSSALSVKEIFGFIGRLGADYYFAVVMWFVAFLSIAVVMNVAGNVLPATAVAVISSALTICMSLYASHLLGWAVYRHRDAI